ncbi:MAG TPA: hypothetical protein PLS43_05015, partial [Syntrophales bacterium]|nr:hypothetical protein [Syntrophales bacterium]
GRLCERQTGHRKGEKDRNDDREQFLHLGCHLLSFFILPKQEACHKRRLMNILLYQDIVIVAGDFFGPPAA